MKSHCGSGLETEIDAQVSVLKECPEGSSGEGYCNRNKGTVSEWRSTCSHPQGEREEGMGELLGEKALLEKKS